MVENVILNIEILRGERKDGGEEDIYFWQSPEYMILLIEGGC